MVTLYIKKETILARKYPIYYEKKGELGLKGWFKFGNAIYKKETILARKYPIYYGKKRELGLKGWFKFPQ